MEAIKLTALRDFAVDHLPRAQQTRKQKHATTDDYHYALYGAAILALASATATAVEQAAAQLLRLTMSLSINWEADKFPTARRRYELGHQAIASAGDLCKLTDTSLPWLTDAMTHEAPPPAPPEPEAAPLPPLLALGLAPLVPGIALTTAEAAAYLKCHPQTLRNWASNGTGPLQPTRTGNRLYWQSVDVLRATTGK
ncbi:helix-turn-helix domain-containing protein [Duganella sp. BuS-21]|uniref:helix-turn-helix domain-containing protein n=1 Tax=Duganella sp. BuS-21 TaxID=2943848 RepID=UPI0035A5E20D